MRSEPTTTSCFVSTFCPRPLPSSSSKNHACHPCHPCHPCRSLKQSPRCVIKEPPTETPLRVPPVPRPSRKSGIGIAVDTVTETIEDAYLHYSRLFRRQKKKIKRPRIVVLGSGWGGHALIKVIETEMYDVTVVSPRNYFFFTPLLSSASTGTVEFRSLVDPVRRANEYVEYLEAMAVDVDINEKTVLCRANVGENSRNAETFTLPYDHLVISVGATANTFGIPGVADYAFQLKELGDARKLRGAIIDRLERASLPSTSEEERQRLTRFVVVGGGFVGLEMAGELKDFVETDVRDRYKDLKPTLTVLQSGQTILSALETKLQQKAMQNFRKRDINLVTGARVVEVSPREVRLQDGRRVSYGILVWATGNGPRPFVTNLINKVPEQRKLARNKLIVDSWLRVVGAPRVYSLGDCAAGIDDPLPATAQVAGQQGAYLARLFNKASSFDGEVPTVGKEKKKAAKSFQYASLGLMTYLGGGEALMQVEATEKRNISLSGSVAYFLWSSVYLTKQVSFRSRVLVLFDWFKSQVFGRDVSRF